MKRALFVAELRERWRLHRSVALGMTLVGGWVSEPPGLTQLLFKVSGRDRVFGLAARVPTSSEATDEELGWQAHFLVWELLEPRDLDDSVQVDGIWWVRPRYCEDDLHLMDDSLRVDFA